MAMSSGMLVVNQEKTSSSLPPKRIFIYLTVKTSGSLKRKTNEVIDLCLENLSAEDVLLKFLSFFSGCKYQCDFSFHILPFIFFMMIFVFQVSDHVSADLLIWWKRMK